MKRLPFFLLLFLLLSHAEVKGQTEGKISPQFQELDDKIRNDFLHLRPKLATAKIEQQGQLAEKSGNDIEKAVFAHNKGLFFFMTRGTKDSIYDNYAIAEAIYAREKLESSLLQIKLSLISYYEKYDRDVDLGPLIEESIQMADQLESKLYLYRAKRAKAKLFSGNGKQAEALRIAFEIEKLWDEFSIEDKMASPNPYVVFMSIYYANGENSKTIAPLEKLIAHAKEVKDTATLIQSLNNVAPKYIIVQNDTNKYLKTLHQSKSYSQQIGHKYGEANTCNQLASYYMDVNLDSCKFYLDQIDYLLPVIEEAYFLGTVSRIRGLYYEYIDQYKKAEYHYKKSKDIFFDLGNLAYEKKAVNYLVDVNEVMGDYKDAFFYEKRKSAITDSLLNRKSIEAFKEAELQRDFDDLRFQDSLSALAATQKRELVFQQELSNERQNSLIIWGIVILLAIVTVFIYVSLRRNKAVNKSLEEKNLIIEKSLQEKQLLLKEIHHRVKNNFQIVSSLIELQSKGIEDEQYQIKAKEGQNRLQSMALIHQKLYQNDDLTVDLEDYLKKLVGNITESYQLSEVETTLAIKDSFSVDIDTAIPLGLILNELITNAFKYAFDDSKINSLKVELLAGVEFHELTVTDNGEGLPALLDIEKINSLGLKLVKRLVRQLHGRLDYQTDNGAVFKVFFKDTIMRAEVD